MRRVFQRFLFSAFRSQSNRPEQDAATQAILMSVYLTLKLRGLTPTETIANDLKTFLATGLLPPLPPATR